MDLNSAYSTLGLSQNASESEVKKAFRNLSKKYHPDQNKDPGAEKKYKEITEAYNLINNPSEHDRINQNSFNNEDFFSGFPFNINFNGFGNFGKQRKIRQPQPIVKEINLTFEESILGKSIKINVNRMKGCDDCEGDGIKEVNNGCKDCGGKGKKVVQQSNFVTVTDCKSCKEKRSTESCKTCSGKGHLDASSDYDVKIPGGVINGNVLNMQNAGNFIGYMHGEMIHSDVLVKINVLDKPGFKLENGVVKTNINISLLDALRGIKMNVETVLGEKEIIINSNTKSNDKIVIPNVGVNRIGNQEINIIVDYPKNTEKLIQFLENNDI